MLLRELVRINEDGLVANAVNFNMIADEQKNQLLCQGFVFNYDNKTPKSSTVGILDALRRSYHSPNEPNVHLLVQDYGKGKSHFGLVIANFFKQPYGSPEFQGIHKQLEIATSNHPNGQTVFEGLKGYKKRSKKHLVICLSGEQGDIKKIFLRSLRNALEAEGIINSIAQHLCSQPILYLEELNAQELAKAEKYLESISYHGDVRSLIRSLKEDDYKVIPTVIDISRELTGGYPINFEADLNLEAILEDILKNYCSGANCHFEGILILLDELNAYLQSWASNPAAAGGMALQNITNICENYKGKIALMSFTQIRPSNAAAIPLHSQEIKTYQKLTSRLEENTYEPISSLELVLSNLITYQNDSLREQFIDRWNGTIFAESRDAYENRISIYRERDWGLENFYNLLALSCFPLHPITAYLLCNLDFTQGRTAIQFIKEDVKTFIQNDSSESNGKLNYIYPVKLVDSFEDNFSNYSIYKDYQKAYHFVVASASPEEIIILKGIFLFYASGNKLSKSDKESHEDILSLLTGLSPLKVKQALDQLCQTRRVIYKLPNNTYGFYSGVGILELEEQIDNEVASEQLSGHKYSIKEVLEHCRTSLQNYLKSKTIDANHFVEKNQLLIEDWQFERKIYTISEIQEIINSGKLPKNIEEKGLLGYVIAETEKELQNFRDEINNLLSNSPIRYQIAIAIPRQGITDIANTLQKFQKLREKSTGEKQALGQALSQLVEQYEQQVKQRLKEVFKSCTYHCSVLDKIPNFDRENPVRIVSALLEELYPFVPPVNNSDKMALKKTSGSKIIGFAAKQLLADNLTPQILPDNSYKNVIDPIFVTQWRLLKSTSQKYSVTVPTHERVRAAWDKISEMTKLKDETSKSIDLSKIWQELSAPPYGYNEFTFTILLSAWLAYHRTEVSLKGEFGIPQKKKDTVIIQTKPLKEWARTNILDKPKDFVNTWIVGTKPYLIRRFPSPCPEIPLSVNYDEAQKYLQEIEDFLQSDNPDPLKVEEIKKKQQQLRKGIENIDDWLKPIQKAENLLVNVAIDDELVPIYSSLLEAQKPPQVANKEGVIDVCPTQDQCDRSSNVLQSVQAKINAVVNEYQERAKSPKTFEQYGTYKVEVQNTIKQLKQTKDLPNHLIETLESSLQDANKNQEALRQQQKSAQCLSEIQNLFKGLGSNATQNDYSRIRSQIEQLVQNVPEVKFEKIYQQIIQAIEQHQKELNNLIEQWQGQYAEINYRAQVTQLRDQIISQKNRFTESESQQAIETLLAQLEGKISELRSQEKQKAAQTWLKDLETQIQQLEQLNNPQVKLENANQILGQIQTQKPIHFDRFNEEQQQSVEEIEKQCIKIQNQDRENQILVMFQQLPSEQQISLYQKLSQYLPSN